LYQSGDETMTRAGKAQIVMGAAAVAAGLVLRSSTRPRYSFRGKSVLITGGSRGLGLLIARILAREGARLTLVARHRQALEVAQAELTTLGANVWVVDADVRLVEDAQSIVQQSVDRFGGLDVLINNAGVIQVGPFDSLTTADFEDAMNTHFWGPFHLCRAAIPEMRRRHGGRIVNISSIGGRIAVPHLMAYSASKFALAGFSDGLRAELAADRIRVTSVYPGLLRTGSHVNANFKGDHEKEFAWFSTMAGLPVFSINGRRAARQIVEACRGGRAELIITTQARVAVAAQAVAPSLVAWSMRLMQALLPVSGGDSPLEQRSGWDSMSEWSPSALTQLADRAIEENNEFRVA
jgi:NAD(P)-dependent dehydrogenase (short-subunit alcohol dehydrogenase family)